jgi:hypothetical protein
MSKRTMFVGVLVLILMWIIAIEKGFTQEVTINIDKQTATFIEGEVKGLQYPQDYKVVVYSKNLSGTHWIKQPRPGNQKGYSWAEIRPDGQWALGLVARFSQKMRFTKSYIAVVLPKTAPAPDTLLKIDYLKPIAKGKIEAK